MLGSAVPNSPNSGDLTVGVRFDVLAAGIITHVRYWHIACASVTHHEALYRWNGSAFVRVASATSLPAAGFTGWYQVPLPTPVAVAAGETYLATHSWDNTDATGATGPGTSLSPNLTWVSASYGFGSDVLPNTPFGADLSVDVVYQTGLAHVHPAPVPADTLAAVLAAGNTTGERAIIMPSGILNGRAATTAIAATALANGVRKGAQFYAGAADTVVGGTASLVGGDGDLSSGAILTVSGAESGTNKPGGDITLGPGPGAGTGRRGLIRTAANALPTTDPAVPDAWWKSPLGQVVVTGAVPAWVQMTQAAYNALGTKNPNVLYVIVG